MTNFFRQNFFAYISVKLKKILIESYIVENLMKRPTTCSSIVSKFEYYFSNSSNFQLCELTFLPLHLLGSWTPFLSFYCSQLFVRFCVWCRMFEYLVCFSISGTQGEGEKYRAKEELRASYEQSLVLCLKVDEDEDSDEVQYKLADVTKVQVKITMDFRIGGSQKRQLYIVIPYANLKLSKLLKFLDGENRWESSIRSNSLEHIFMQMREQNEYSDISPELQQPGPSSQV